ncbi:uncharacterized protein SCHCODRAFT_02492674 [Schizophyllum commune H4-8]|nr:uncharacterized protein SCHCODRAFT_02492674 [Schizophyllum commune H4-8]KAI5896172.1 hypothetical protein SCHCODRAFT_02492674 [Schizophyllum commune H4-8]
MMLSSRRSDASGAGTLVVSQAELLRLARAGKLFTNVQITVQPGDRDAREYPLSVGNIHSVEKLEEVLSIQRRSPSICGFDLPHAAFVFVVISFFVVYIALLLLNGSDDKMALPNPAHLLLSAPR